jgi:hypothetical protein
MYSTPLILMVAMAAFDLGQAEKGVDPAVAAARARQERAKTVVLEFKLTTVDQPGSRSGQLDAVMRQAAGLTKTVPEKETTSESKNRMVLDGAKMRIEINHPMWSLAEGKLLPSPRVEVCDGEAGKYLYTLGIAGDGKPKGRVHGAADSADFRLTLLNPIYFAFRGTDREVCPYPIGVFKPTGATVPIAGATCNEYVVNRGDMIVTAWFDPGADYTIRRFTETQKGKLRRQIDAEHRRDEKWGWVPAAWTLAEYDMAGDLMWTEQVAVFSLDIGEPQPASEFQIRFPPDTRLFDMRNKKYYRIQPDESMLEISADGKPLGSGAKIPQPSGSEVPQADESFFSRHKWLLISAATALVVVIVFLFARRRFGRVKVQ